MPRTRCSTTGSGKWRRSAPGGKARNWQPKARDAWPALFILNTDTLSLSCTGGTTRRLLVAVSNHAADLLAICTTTPEEQVGGWSGLARAAKTPQQHADAATFLTAPVSSWHAFAPVPQTVASHTRFASLVKSKLNVGRNDLRIAAVALELGGTVVSRNRRDFGRVPGLLIDDWSV